MLLGASAPPQQMGGGEDPSYIIQESIVKLSSTLSQIAQQTEQLAAVYPAFQGAASQISDSLETIYQTLNQGMLDTIAGLRQQEAPSPPGMGMGGGASPNLANY